MFEFFLFYFNKKVIFIQYILYLQAFNYNINILSIKYIIHITHGYNY